MAELTHLSLADATERTTTSTSLVEVTQHTVTFEALETAGFAAGDVVFIIWEWTLNAASTSAKASSNLGHGTSFATMTNFFSVDSLVESQDTSALNGGRRLGWAEEHTLVTGEDFYTGLATESASFAARVGDFSIHIFKQSDLAAGDYRWSTGSGLTTTTSWQTDATVDLPATSGDDWLILGFGEWDYASISSTYSQRLEVASTAVMTRAHEAEDAAEQLPLMTAYYHAAAGVSDTINFQATQTTGTAATLDRSRILALRMEAFVDHAGLYDATTDALSGTVDTYVETGTISLSLTDTGNVFAIGQSIVDAANTNTDPYMRLQEGGSDIVTSLGRLTDHARETTDFIAVSASAIGSMTSGTKTIDMDVATDENASASNTVDERTLVAFSLELAGGAPPAATAVTPGLLLTGAGA